MSNKKKYLLLSLPVLLLFLIIISLSTKSSKNTHAEFTSTFDPNPPSPSVILPTEPATEAIPYSWEDYDNEKFSFKLTYPSEWYKKEYKRNPKGGIFVAFSPNPLPCEDCSYINSAFFSVKIYSQQTDPESYTAFAQRIKAIGKVEGYNKARLGGVDGVYYKNIFSVENRGWVYELTLEKDLGNPGVDDSQIFKKVLSSFQFTYLIFKD
jgi:hypothetical protein